MNAIFKRIFIEGQCLYLNERPIREITISYPPQCREKTQKTPHLPKEPKPSDPILQGTSFHILVSFYFQFELLKSTLFITTPISKMKSQV